MSVSSAAGHAVVLEVLIAPPQPWQPDAGGEADYHDMEGFARAEPRVCAAGAVPADAQCVFPGDVLVSMRASAPRRAWVVGDARGRPQAASAEWLILRGDDLDPAYARQLFVSNAFELACRARVPNRRSRQPRGADLGAIAIALPTRPMQVAAARVMDHADTLRRRRAVVVERGRELAQALFVEQFGGSAQTTFAPAQLSTLLSEPPCRGAEVPLAARGRFPVIRVDDLYDGEVSLADARYVSRSDAALARTALADGDVLLAHEPGRTEMRVAIARPGDAVWFMHAKLWRLRLDTARALPEYLRAWLRSAPGQRSLAEAWRSPGARVPMTQRLADMAVPLPPIEAQRQFAQRLNAADRLVGRLLVSSERFDALLGALRDLAFRGELQLA